VRLWYDIIEPLELVASEDVVETLADEAHRQHLSAHVTGSE